MARLTDPIVPDVEYRETGFGLLPVNWQAELDWMNEYLDSRPTDGYIGAVVRFPVADNFAFYEIVDLDGPTLAHVEFGDRYTIPDAHLRGLTAADVTKQVDYLRAMQRVFSKEA